MSMSAYGFELIVDLHDCVDRDVAEQYLKAGDVNPWGGIEAKMSKHLADALDKPVAHAPLGSTFEDFNEIVDPRMAAETVSVAYIHFWLYCITVELTRRFSDLVE